MRVYNNHYWLVGKVNRWLLLRRKASASAIKGQLDYKKERERAQYLGYDISVKILFDTLKEDLVGWY